MPADSWRSASQGPHEERHEHGCKGDTAKGRLMAAGQRSDSRHRANENARHLLLVHKQPVGGPIRIALRSESADTTVIKDLGDPVHHWSTCLIREHNGIADRNRGGCDRAGHRQ